MSVLVWSSEVSVSSRFIPRCDGKCLFDTYKREKCLVCGYSPNEVEYTFGGPSFGLWGYCASCDACTYKCECPYMSVSPGKGEKCGVCDKPLDEGESVVSYPYEATYYDAYDVHLKCYFAA